MTHPLEKWLEEANETKTEFAERAGVSRMALWRTVQGTEISIEMLRKISKATNGGLSVAQLLPHQGADRAMDGTA